jgi:hypothetical protein
MSIKKNLMVLSLLMTILFVAGCGSGDSDERMFRPPNNGDSSKLPPVPQVSVNDGKITESNYAGMANEIVTQNNLEEFAEAFYSAAVLGLWPIIVQHFNNWDGINSAPGMFGHLVWESIESKDYGQLQTSTQTIKFFDFSLDGNLFLGGAIGMAALEYGDNKTYDEGYELKDNGTIEFRGTFSGSIIYKNVKETYKGTKDKTEYEYSGELIIKSGGKEMNLSPEEYAKTFAFKFIF